jgi:transcriptional regulator GlxA family with amidase domain
MAELQNTLPELGTPRYPLHLQDWPARAVEAGYSLEVLARNCGYSLRSLQRHVSERFRMSLRDFVAEMRLQHAGRLLGSGFSVKEVAFALAYKRSSHFVRCYRQRFGTTPGRRARLSNPATRL